MSQNLPVSSLLLSKQYEKALVMAFQLHQVQKRKATQIPYIAHLLSVSALVLEFGGTENEAIAALLHDAVEDQGGMAVLAEIEAQFGAEVAEIVIGCSDSTGLPKLPWKTRKTQYLQHLANASSSIQLVSLADKLHNLRDILMTYRKIGEKTWDRFNGKKEGTLWYYQNLVSIFAQSRHTELAAELGRVYHQLNACIASSKACT
jgi:(p)ppGpp synthase/HD superfamily hydrolase